MGNAVAAAGFLEVAVSYCGEIYKTVNEHVADDGAEDIDPPGEVFVLMCALDYKRTKNPLSCSIDAKNMQKFIDACQVPRENVKAMFDEECTVDNVLAAMEEVGGRAGEGDFFVFYYSGHGTNLKDVSGDEEDGEDEAFCFVTEDGQICYDSCLTDDAFADAITSAVAPEAKIIILTDCCHSGTIADFHNGDWANRQAVSITGCLDAQTSGDIGKGGIFTHSLLMAAAELQRQGEDEYTVAKIYNTTLEKDNDVFHSQQDICLQCSPGQLPGGMAWPLVPQVEYVPPMGLRCIS